MDEVMMQTFERFTARLIVRQRAMYAADVPFLQKWRTAMGFLDEDLAAGYPKVWLELQALGWNRPEMRDRVAAMTAEWRGVLTEAFGKAAAEYHLDPGPVSGRGVGEPGDDLQPGSCCSSACPASPKAIASCSAGSTTGWYALEAGK